MVRVDAAQVDAAGQGRCDNGVGRPGDVRQHRVEEHLVHDVDVGSPQPVRERHRVAVHPLGDLPQPVRPVVGAVERRDDGEQGLRRADVARRLLAPDVLLPRLQRQPVRNRAVGVVADADQATGQGPLQPGAHRDVRGVWAAVEEGDAEALRRADRDVRTELARRRQQRQREQVGGHGDQGAALVRRGDERPQVPHHARGPRLLRHHAHDVGVVGQAVGEVRDDDRQAERRRAPTHHRERLRQAVGIHDDDAVLASLDCAAHQQHGLHDGRRLVQQ